MLDPLRIPFNALPPPVHIEQVTVDRRVLDAPALTSELRLPPLTRDLQIAYTALSLVAPEKMQFRYLLEGYDREWQDAGNRREAFYTNLPPRAYRFRVIAANNDGVWNETGAMLGLRHRARLLPDDVVSRAVSSADSGAGVGGASRSLAHRREASAGDHRAQ